MTIKIIRSQKRIQHVASGLDNPSAGTTYSISRLTDSISYTGYEIELVALEGKHNLSDSYKICSSVDTKRFQFEKSLGYFAKRIGYSRDFINYSLNNEKDLIHIHGLWMLPNIVPAYSARKFNTPLMISSHGMLGGEALKFSRLKKNLMLWLCQRKVLDQATCLRATSVKELEELRSFGLRQPVALVPNGVDLLLNEPIVAEGRYILSLGRIHPIKGLGNLILAWAALAERFPQWSLRIVGPDEGGHKEELIRLIAKHQIPRVTLEFPVFGQEKWELMAGAGLFVLPSLNENFANTVAESLSVGVPAISSKGAPWSDLEARKCGWWVGGDVESLSAAMALAIALPECERRAMGRRGRAWVRSEFSWDSLGERMAAVYDWMLGIGEPTRDIIFD